MGGDDTRMIHTSVSFIFPSWMFQDVPQLPKNPTGVLHLGCSPNAISMGVSRGKFVGLHGNQSNKHISLD